MEKVYDSKATLDLLYTTGPKAIRSDVRDTFCIGECWAGLWHIYTAAGIFDCTL